MKYNLLVLDVDGTIVRNQITPLSKNVTKSIRKASKKIKISLCTGRTKGAVKDLIKKFKIGDSYHVIEGGTKVLNPQGKYEYIKSLSYNDVLEIVKVAGNVPFNYGFCVDSQWVPNIEEAKYGTITNVSLNSNTKKQTEAILIKVKILANKYHIAVGTHINLPSGNHVLLTKKNASKEFGLKYIQRKTGIKKEETIGVGDMPNDLPIFKAVGFKVAMANGDIQLKKLADYIAPSVDKDGLIEVIEKFILND
ncbi:HAD family phosphatase [Candidatus Roizmanbacteria bacterium]|nr:HAD family phosphatase [Candidatus Roizmanbacteria bacterium]